ncbi:MAG: hypothetical protein QW478_06710 [Candidatus Micrarchaeaceae archaeon]
MSREVIGRRERHKQVKEEISEPRITEPPKKKRKYERRKTFNEKAEKEVEKEAGKENVAEKPAPEAKPAPDTEKKTEVDFNKNIDNKDLIIKIKKILEQ